MADDNTTTPTTAAAADGAAEQSEMTYEIPDELASNLSAAAKERLTALLALQVCHCVSSAASSW
jgi:hypothetical protein